MAPRKHADAGGVGGGMVTDDEERGCYMFFMVS